MERGEEQARRGPKEGAEQGKKGKAGWGYRRRVQTNGVKKSKVKEKGSRIEGGGRGGQTEDRQMEGTRRDRWEGREADGERSHGGKEGRVEGMT